MKELNKKEWENFKKFVKNLEETAPDVNISVATIIIKMEKDYSDVLF